MIFQKLLIKLLEDPQNSELQQTFLHLNNLPFLRDIFKQMYTYNRQMFFVFYSLLVGMPNSNTSLYVQIQKNKLINESLKKDLQKYTTGNNDSFYKIIEFANQQKVINTSQWKRLLEVFYEVNMITGKDKKLYFTTLNLCRQKIHEPYFSNWLKRNYPTIFKEI